jgi:hypothetical protein
MASYDFSLPDLYSTACGSLKLAGKRAAMENAVSAAFRLEFLSHDGFIPT